MTDPRRARGSAAECEPADGRTREVGIAAARQRRPGAVMQQAGSEQEQAAVVEPQLAATPATEAARALVVDGAARVCGVLNESLCDRLRAEIDAQLASAVETGADRANAAGFAPVRTPDRRWDMYQSPATAAVGEALQVLLSGTLGDIFRDLFDGDDDAPLVELSALITDLGAAAQPIHQDTDMDVQTWTAFVALQDIDCTMGPTLMLPGERCHPPTVLYSACSSQRRTIWIAQCATESASVHAAFAGRHRYPHCRSPPPVRGRGHEGRISRWARETTRGSAKRRCGYHGLAALPRGWSQHVPEAARTLLRDAAPPELQGISDWFWQQVG